MTALTLYIDGSINFTSGNAQIVGSGTAFTTLIEGDPIMGPDGKWYELNDILTDTSATLDRAYTGVSVAGAVGGTDWVILKASKDRDSVRTATRQLTDITSTYRKVINLTNSDQTVRLNKATAADRAGMILQKAGIDQFQNGVFEDDEFSIRYLLASTWTKALGIAPSTGGVSLYSQLLLGNTLSPLQLTATTNNYAPTGIDQANVLRISTNGPVSLTGIAGGVDGRLLLLLNVGDNDLDLENEGGSSSDLNRFKLTGNMTLPSNSSILLIYDGATARWRQAAGAGGAGGGDSEGDKGWSPILGYQTVGGRVVARILDWTGGEGSKPAAGAYIGPTGLVDVPASAVNVQGPAGEKVQFRVNLPAKSIQWSYDTTIEWVDLISFEDITGPPAALEWVFSSATADENPGVGVLRFDSATFSTIGHIYLSAAYRQGSDASAWINSFDDSSSLPNRGTILMIDTLDQTKFATFQVTDAVVSASGYLKIPVTPLGGNIFGVNRRVSLIFLRTGDKGIPGIIPRGAFNSTTSYIVGDVVDYDGSSYISLIQPNINHAPSFEMSDANWALFARGVNAEFITAINLTLTNATAQANAALASQVLATNYAVKIDGYAASTDNSSKSWAVGGSGQGQPVAGDAKSWAIKTTATVDGSEYSAKEYAQGSQAGAGGSAKNWASSISGPVSGGLYSSRQYAINASVSYSNSVLLEAQAAQSATDAASANTAAQSASTTAIAQATVATNQASSATTSATAATNKAAEAVTSAAAALASKNDATTAATASSASAGNSATSASAAAGSAAAAAGYAAALANPDYGFFVDAPSETRDYGSFV